MDNAPVTIKWRPTDHIFAGFSGESAVVNGDVIGSVRQETSGPKRGQWTWSMSMDAPAVEMRRLPTGGYVQTEAEAKAALVESYQELQRLAAEAGTIIGEGTWPWPRRNGQ
jgi:hypothetical protein